MKRIIYICLLTAFGSFGVFAQKTATTNKAGTKVIPQKIEREKFDPKRNASEDLQNAVSKATQENKRIILDIGGEWCVWCINMDKFFIANSEITKLRDENFVWLKINMSPENENTEFLAKYPKIPGYPHLYVLEKNGEFLFSKFTAELEKGKSYNLEKFTAFLNEWSLPANESVDKGSKNNYRDPEITIDEALLIGKEYIIKNNINISDKYIDSVKFNLSSDDKSKNYWLITWELNNRTSKGGQIFMKIYMDKSVEIGYGE